MNPSGQADPYPAFSLGHTSPRRQLVPLFPSGPNAALTHTMEYPARSTGFPPGCHPFGPSVGSYKGGNV